MTSSLFRISLLLYIFYFSSCTSSQRSNNERWELLFNGSDLSNWETYLGPVFQPGVSWDSVKKLDPIGLNNDTAQVFSVVALDGEKVIRISGKYFGGLSTKKEYENVHVQLEFKWGKLKWFPRDKDSDKRDSGLLYYGIGEHGEGDGFWLRSQEFQIQEGDCGDYWGVAGALADITASLNEDSVYQYDKNGSLFTFTKDNNIGRYCQKFPDAEKPNGEWNTLDLYTYNGTSLHIVNGILVMKLQNSRLPDDTSLTKGKIQLQSEAAEIYYRNIKVREINELPEF